MSNCALAQSGNVDRPMIERGIEFLRASVGDRYVLEMMTQVGASLGGEPSGHVILLNSHTAGDGILTAVKLAEILGESGATLDNLAAGLLISVSVICSKPCATPPRLSA